MSNPVDQFKVKLNQNLWGLVVSFGALGVAEYYSLSTLFWFAAVASMIMTISLGFTTWAYTVKYWQERVK
jgi:hypothetical protein